jgi:serine phosphatase RsbU (regulator of sigma subunit)
MFSYANAGHVPGYLLDPSGEIEGVLEATGIPLGIMPNPEYKPSTVMRLEQGKVLAMLTDGIMETMAPDDSEFGVDRTLALIRENRANESAQIAQALFEAARSHARGRPQQDDITCVVCKIRS